MPTRPATPEVAGPAPADLQLVLQDPALLRDTDLPITDIAFQTGWSSLGTFGRTFRDITGKAPGEVRARARAAVDARAPIPACIVRASERPRLTIAVSEKRRRATHGTKTRPQEEVP